MLSKKTKYLYEKGQEKVLPKDRNSSTSSRQQKPVKGKKVIGK